MNSTSRPDGFRDAFIKNFIAVFLCVAINTINGSFIYIYFRSEVFKKDPRYVLYIHLVINDIIMLTGSVLLQVITYLAVGGINVALCCTILVVMVTTNKNSPVNLACMAVERYIAVCRPLHHPQLCTVGRTYCLIGLIWGASFIDAFADIIIIFVTRPLSFFSVSMMCFADAIFSVRQHKDKTSVVQVVLVSMVFLTLVITYLKVLFAARKASGDDQVSARKARNTILLHGVQLLICMLSYASPILTMHLIRSFPTNFRNILFPCFLLTNVLPRLLSPLIYGVRDQKFSSQLRLLFSCRSSGPGEGERLKPTAGERVRPMKGKRETQTVGERGSSKKMNKQTGRP
ncbi:unnamed protein product [Arctogadus glacialis]